MALLPASMQLVLAIEMLHSVIVLHLKRHEQKQGIGHASRPKFHWDQSPELYDNTVQLS